MGTFHLRFLLNVAKPPHPEVCGTLSKTWPGATRPQPVPWRFQARFEDQYGGIGVISRAIDAAPQHAPPEVVDKPRRPARTAGPGTIRIYREREIMNPVKALENRGQAV